MSDTTRTFIAIAVPTAVEGNLVRLQAELAPAVPGYRWVSVPLHLTLAFLGDMKNKDLAAVCLAVSSSVEAIEPLHVEMRGLGAFPTPDRSRVLWAGVTAVDPKPLFELRDSIVDSLARIGHRPDDPRFHPHVTLGRIKHDRGRTGDLRALIERHRDWSAGGFTVKDVRVFASTLGPTGSVYSELDRCRLGGKKSEGRA
jgi:RNA 2',3'-cyclic 3'-phosphodiesterase